MYMGKNGQLSNRSKLLSSENFFHLLLKHKTAFLKIYLLLRAFLPCHSRFFKKPYIVITGQLSTHDISRCVTWNVCPAGADKRQSSNTACCWQWHIGLLWDKFLSSLYWRWNRHHSASNLRTPYSPFQLLNLDIKCTPGAWACIKYHTFIIY